jgi:ubiquinone/menaquinone biosynthesis C-methylase UbiE
MIRFVLMLTMGAAVLFMFRQCRKPRGAMGRRTLEAMNLGHSALTDWGLSNVEIGKTFTILDVGCGGGRTIQKLAARASEGKVFGVDYSPACVEMSREKNAEAVAAGRVDIRHASVSQLPFSDASFDLVTAVETSYYWPNFVSDLAEVRRVLKPGGRLVLIVEAYARGVRGPFYKLVMAPMSGKVLSADQHRAALSAAGYTDIGMREDRLKGWLAVSAT